MTATVMFVNLRRIKREGLESLAAARRLGYDVVLLGRSLPDLARPWVTEFRQVNTFDTEESVAAAVELATRYEIVGVPSFTEVDIQLTAAIAARLGLRGLPEHAALRARNKYAMKRALDTLDGVLPRYRRVRDYDELVTAVQFVGLPAVVKPTGASGSKGIFELRTRDDLEPAMRRLSEIADPGFDPVFQQFGAEFIVEEYLDGVEFSVEGFVAGGSVEIVAVTDKVTTEPFHLELEHKLPSTLPDEALRQVRTRTVEVLVALQFDDCSFHLEAKWGSGGFRFIEVAARPAGDYIASHLVPLATGIDFFANVIRVSVGAPLQVVPDRDLAAGLRFVLAQQEGTFRGTEGLHELFESPEYHHLFYEQPVGTAISLPPKNFGTQRVVAVCARHHDRAGLNTALDRVGAEVSAQIEVPVPT